MGRSQNPRKDEIIQAVKAALSSGSSKQDACDAQGISAETYNRWLLKAPRAVVKAKRPKTYKKKGVRVAKHKTPQLITFEATEPNIPLVILMGQARDVGAALERLASMSGGRPWVASSNAT
jgi:hypothetical protein